MALTRIGPAAPQSAKAKTSRSQSALKVAANNPGSCVGEILTPTSPQAIRRAQELGLPLLDLARFDSTQLPAKLVAPHLLRLHRVLPLGRRGCILFLAVCNPANTAAFNDIMFHTGLKLELVLVASAQLEGMLARFLETHNPQRLTQPDWNTDALKRLAQEAASARDPGSGAVAVHEAPIVALVNQLLHDARQQRASDIHIEPYEKSYRIRYRLDGVLRIVATPPLSLAARIASRLKVMANLDISEKRQPQDGRIKIRISPTVAFDARVSVLPTLWGEKLVLRLLDANSLTLGVDALGFDAVQKQQFLAALQRKQGLILVTGPTGSGKSVCLYTGLTILNSPERNISTAEDPVEMNLEGINQVSINRRSGFGFAEALRAFLRQDPDVVMIGEMRDPETVDMAIKAAQTGHLVLSTLHTNGAIETITRLLNLGVSAFNLASSVQLIIAQRLARRLCPHCKERLTVSEKILRDEGFEVPAIDTLQLYRAVGCRHCHAGYSGRTGIYEVVPVTDRLSRLIMQGASPAELATQARAEGFTSLRDAALGRVAQGITSLDEVNRLR